MGGEEIRSQGEVAVRMRLSTTATCSMLSDRQSIQEVTHESPLHNSHVGTLKLRAPPILSWRVYKRYLGKTKNKKTFKRKESHCGRYDEQIPHRISLFTVLGYIMTFWGSETTPLPLLREAGSHPLKYLHMRDLLCSGEQPNMAGARQVPCWWRLCRSSSASVTADWCCGWLCDTRDGKTMSKRALCSVWDVGARYNKKKDTNTHQALLWPS